MAAVVLVIFLHNSFFQIEEDKIKETITQELLKTEGKNYTIQDIQMRKQLDLKFRKIVVYSFPSADEREIIGTANLYKGLNNKYAVGEIYCQKKFVYLFVVKDFATKYLIIAGKNNQSNIDYIELTNKEGNSYKEDISKEEYFIYKKNVNLLRSYRMLDKEGKEIPLAPF
ncbi:hypothetical protein [Desulfotomaculum sp. 1211_IL3151]|uniref:hypothetical protein n=1 Tax=Desulfotomaculum sp. 1211_IL3151 TaxID=3084055 RepID=UPI002FD92C8C